MKRQYSNKKQKNKKRGQRTSMFFAQSKLFHLLSVNTGIAEWASQWLRGVCSFNGDFQRLPKVCRRSNEASRFFSSKLIFNSHWLKLARKSWWSAQAFDFIRQVYGWYDLRAKAWRPAIVDVPSQNLDAALLWMHRMLVRMLPVSPRQDTFIEFTVLKENHQHIC